MNLNSWLKACCFVLALGSSLLSTFWQMRDIKSPYYSDRVVACLTLALVTTTVLLVYRRKSWPVWFIACTLIGLVGSFIYFERIYYPPQLTFPLGPLLDIHDSLVPGAYIAFAFATLAGAAWLEFVTSESYAQYRSANRILLAVAVLVLLSIGYAWSPFDNSVTNILQSSESNDVKLTRLASYLKTGDDFKAFRNRVRDYAAEDIRLDYRVFHYTYRKIGLQVVTMSDGRVYAIGHHQGNGCEWLVRPGDLMWPGNPSTATCGPYSVDHRIKEILDDCFSSSYAARKCCVNTSLRNSSTEAELKRLQDGIEQWECNRLRDRLSLYVHEGEDIEFFLKIMKETPDHETSPDGTFDFWRFPTSGLLLVSQIRSDTRLVSPTETKIETVTSNRVVEIGCQRAGKSYWFIDPGNPKWHLGARD